MRRHAAKSEPHMYSLVSASGSDAFVYAGCCLHGLIAAESY